MGFTKNLSTFLSLPNSTQSYYLSFIFYHSYFTSNQTQLKSTFFFFFFFMNKKKGLTRVIIDPAHLNSLLMAWGTPRHVRDIRIVAQHFCEAHNSNLTTLALVGVIKSRTPTNTPQLKSTWRDLFLRYDLEGPRKDFGTLLGSKEEERGFGAYTRPWAHKYAMCKSKSKK